MISKSKTWDHARLLVTAAAATAAARGAMYIFSYRTVRAMHKRLQQSKTTAACQQIARVRSSPVTLFYLMRFDLILFHYIYIIYSVNIVKFCARDKEFRREKISPPGDLLGRNGRVKCCIFRSAQPRTSPHRKTTYRHGLSWKTINYENRVIHNWILSLHCIHILIHTYIFRLGVRTLFVFCFCYLLAI